MKLFAAKLNTVIDPAPHLGKIEARLLAVNFADDLINPPELGILEREIRHVKRGRAIVVPMSEHTGAMAPIPWRRCGRGIWRSF